MPHSADDNDESIVLDDLMPRYEFCERHHRSVDATVEATWTALTTLTLADLTITRPLVVLRHLGQSAGAHKALLTDGPVGLLYREDRKVAIAGAIARPWQLQPSKKSVADLPSFLQFADPGWTKYLTEFRVEPGLSRNRCTLSTETRGLSTDERARRRFRLYWTLIRLPSGLIRRDILRSVARTATKPGCG